MKLINRLVHSKVGGLFQTFYHYEIDYVGSVIVVAGNSLSADSKESLGKLMNRVKHLTLCGFGDLSIWN